MITPNFEVSEQLANVFYAVAKDQHIKPIEDGILKQLINFNAFPTNEDPHLVSQTTHNILLAFDSLEALKIPSSKAFGTFCNFYDNHPEIFTDELRKWILEVCTKITNLLTASIHTPGKHMKALRDLLNQKDVEKTKV